MFMQRRLQRRCCDPPDLDCHAANHPRPARLVARHMKLNATINQPIRVPNPNVIPSPSPGLRVTSYPGAVVGETSNPNGVAPSGSRRRAATPLGL